MARTLSDMTTDEFKTMLETTIDHKMAEWLGDPDEGLTLRPELVERIQQQRAEYAAGKRGQSLQDVARELGIELAADV